jgi:hypothetical protein
MSDCTTFIINEFESKTYCVDDPETTAIGSGEATTKPGGDAPAVSTTQQDGGSPPQKTAANTVANTQQTSSLPATTIEGTSLLVAPTFTADPAATRTAAAVSTSRGSDGVSKGAVAGIAIATAVIGAAIAFLIAFLLYKRKSRFPSSRQFESTPELVALAKPGPNTYVQVSQVPPPSSTMATAIPNRSSGMSMSTVPAFLAGVLPPPADDRTIAERVGALFLQMQSHVENFYRDVHASVTPSMEGDLARFGIEGVAMVELLQSSSSPTSAIKHAVVAYVLNLTRPGRNESTLFPPDVVGVRQPEHTADPSELPTYQNVASC